MKLVQDAGISGNQLELELSENIVANCVDHVVQENIQELNAEGIRFAFDDFGTGSSSLAHLQNFPGTSLKIDKSFIDAIETSNEQQRLVAGMIDFTHHINMEVVAEGVETEAQLAILIDMGADYIQGYLLARPARVENTLELLHHWEYRQNNKLAIVNGR